MTPIHCAEFDALLCDYLDGTLDRESRSRLEAHLAECSACAELARDAAEAMAFMGRAADVEPPPQLVTRILYQVPQGRTDGFRGWLNRLLQPVLQPVFQPRYVMGAMLTIVSMAMMTRCAGAPDHPLNAADLDPVRLWTALDNRVHRVWDRSLKTYESMRLVYEVQSRIREWQDQQDDETPRTDRKLPMKLPAKNATEPQPTGSARSL